MPKVGRNQACPCGSGKKYKHCCLPADETRAAEALRARQLAELDGDDDGLTDASNAVVDLVHAARLDEAEAAARALLVRYPEVVDGYERLAMVAQARGNPRQAAAFYRQALTHILEHPDGFDGEQGHLARRADQRPRPPGGLTSSPGSPLGRSRFLLARSALHHRA